jgi:hypothetical protein
MGYIYIKIRLRIVQDNRKIINFSDVHTGWFPGSTLPRAKKKEIFLLLMTCNIFVVSLLRFELKIYNYINIIIIK